MHHLMQQRAASRSQHREVDTFMISKITTTVSVPKLGQTRQFEKVTTRTDDHCRDVLIIQRVGTCDRALTFESAGETVSVLNVLTGYPQRLIGLNKVV